MATAIGSAAGDVAWSLGFLARYAWVILTLAAIPAAQRVYAALHADDDAVYAWPIEMLVALVRLGTIAVVFWLGWRGDAGARRAGIDSAGDAFAALGGYLRHDWPRLVLAVLIAVLVFCALNVLAGPAVELFVRQFTDDPRITQAWSFGVRNLVIIPLFYVFAYGLIRPAFTAA